MSRFLIVFAKIDAADLLTAQKQYGDSRLYEIAVMVAALLVAIAIGSIWAILYSKKKRKHGTHHHHHHSHTPPVAVSATQDDKSEDNDTGRRRVRKMRRPHRPLNPTLAQTRGLPPMRDPNTAPPFP